MCIKHARKYILCQRHLARGGTRYRRTACVFFRCSAWSLGPSNYVLEGLSRVREWCGVYATDHRLSPGTRTHARTHTGSGWPFRVPRIVPSGGHIWHSGALLGGTEITAACWSHLLPPCRRPLVHLPVLFRLLWETPPPSQARAVSNLETTRAGNR